METQDNYIKLDSFLKLKGLCESGGHAKLIIQDGDVLVNGEAESRRGRKLRVGDEVSVGGEKIRLELTDFMK